MALAPLVPIGTFHAWLGATPTGADATRAELVLATVSNLVRSEVGKTWETEEPHELAKVVTLDVAGRVYRNPEAALSYSITRGPFGKAITFPDPKGVGLFLTDDEKATLGRIPTGRKKPRGLRTLRTTRDDPSLTTTYVPTPDGQPFPWYADDVAP